MEIEILNVQGYREALMGIGLSFGLTSHLTFAAFNELPNSDPLVQRLNQTAMKLAKLDGGEDKFLRQISVWLCVRASLAWWKQADTYKVGTVAQSESTMHTLMKHEIVQGCFEKPIFPESLKHLESLRQLGYFDTLVNELPCGWLQRRIWSMNYAVLKNIMAKRKNHKLLEWRIFCKEMAQRLPYAYLLGE